MNNEINFEEFIKNVSNKVVACGDDAEIRKLKSDKIVYYGFNEDNDVVCKNAIFTPEGSSFDVYIDKKFYGHFKLNLYGKHMLLDALACIYMCYLENIDVDLIIENINNFKGAKRRFSETKIGNNIIVDDYAHHPTELKATLSAAKKLKKSTLWCIFQPHTYTRTKSLLNEFAEAFYSADKVIITDIYAAREDDPGTVHSKDLVQKLQHNNVDAIYISELKDKGIIERKGPDNGGKWKIR